jgi:hypothetical protein
MKAPRGYEKSRLDNDRGVKENSPADIKRDRVAIPKFNAQKGKAGAPKRNPRQAG